MLPTLYKKTSTGAIQQWSIEVNGTEIKTTYGQLGGKLQTTVENIREGKNAGRSNQTSPAQQAEAEALATWQKKLKSGYVQSISDAQNDITDDVIEGGVLPMLAPSKSFPFDENLRKKIKFPAYVQPKLDGARCIAIVEEGKASLWSRTRKPIYSAPHIITALESLLPFGKFTLDGEMYNHDYRNSFEDLMSLIRQSKPMPGGENIQYHIYDMVWNRPYEERYLMIGQILNPTKGYGPLKYVETIKVWDETEALKAQEYFESLEYEGAMLRNAHGLYESGKRSQHLQKMKSFVDGEFKIIGANEGKGRDEGTVGAFVCLTPEGKEFKARLKATHERREELFNNPSQWQGKVLTVTYKRLTEDGLPYLPIGKGLRDYE